MKDFRAQKKKLHLLRKKCKNIRLSPAPEDKGLTAVSGHRSGALHRSQCIGNTGFHFRATGRGAVRFPLLLQARPVINVFDLDILEVLHDLHLQIREMIHFQPFAALIGKMIDFLDFQIFKMLDDFYLNVREMIYELDLAIELFSIIGAVRRNFSLQSLGTASCAQEQ